VLWLATDGQQHPGTYTLLAGFAADMASTGLCRRGDAERDYSRWAACAAVPAAAVGEEGRATDRELGDKTRRE